MRDENKENRSEMIHDALNFLDEEMIEEVEKLRGFVEKEELECGLNLEKQMVSIQTAREKKKFWRRWSTLAASVCVLIAGSWIYGNYIKPADHMENAQASFDDAISNPEDTDMEDAVVGEDVSAREESLKEESDAVEENSISKDGITDDMTSAMPESVESRNEGVAIPQMKVNLRKAKEGDLQGDMLGFFILNGNCYIQYEFQTDYEECGADFVGKRVGHITGMIDEWTEADGYVDGAGTYTGDVYEIKGVDPELMLCMVGEDGSVETFLNNNGITLYQGADLVDDWLNLRGNFETLSFETMADNQFVHRQMALSEEEKEICERFLDAFAESEFVYVEEKLNHPFGGDNDTEDMLDFYFVTENGLRLRFRTMGDGYVCFPWINACVQIDMDVYNEMVDFLLKYMSYRLK